MTCTPPPPEHTRSVHKDYEFINNFCLGSLEDYPINTTTGLILDAGMSSKMMFHVIYTVYIIYGRTMKTSGNFYYNDKNEYRIHNVSYIVENRKVIRLTVIKNHDL